MFKILHSLRKTRVLEKEPKGSKENGSWLTGWQRCKNREVKQANDVRGETWGRIIKSTLILG